MLPALCRFQLSPASSYIMTLFEPSANRYAQLLALTPIEQGGVGTQLSQVCVTVAAVE